MSAVRPTLSAVEAAWRAGRRDEAEALCVAALADRPADAALRNALAVLRRGRGAVLDAVRDYRAAIALAPGNATFLANFANALTARGAHAPAERLVRMARSADPARLDLSLLSGNILLRLGRAAEAWDVATRAHAARPAEPRVHYLLGNCRRVAGDEAAARRSFRRSVALAPADGKSRLNLAILAGHRGERAEALRFYDAAVAADPADATARYDRALHLLASGDLEAGWTAYEWRWRAPGATTPRRRTPAPEWDGVARPGETVLLWPEQGVGDEIFYASCIPDLLATGQPIILECDPRLVPLFRHSFPAARVRARTHDTRGIETLDRRDYDRHLPIGSLPRLYRPRLDSFPARRAYLAPDPDAARQWEDRVAALRPGLTVGVAWRSGVMSGDRVHSYPPLAAWRPVFAVPGVRFVNLQFGVGPDERATLRDLGVALDEWPDLDLKDDFMAVAALIASLDLVVTGPCAICMQAGSLGRPVWVLDGPAVSFKYLGTGRMPWIPTWRPFARRSWSEPWDRAIAAAAAALAARARVSGAG